MKYLINKENEDNNMIKSKELVVKKEGFFSKILNKIKTLFRKNEVEVEEANIENESVIKEYNEENNRDNFINNIKVEGNSEILSLKIKLDNGEVKAIDLTDEQIDELQKIYDQEIEEKKNKINKLKGAA